MTRRTPAEPEEPTARACWFCHTPFAEGQKKKYVYPVPDPDRRLSLRHGAFACLDCYPSVTQQQKDLGLLIEVRAAPLEVHG